MELLDMMDAAAAPGATVSIKWFCDSDDDITREFAEDISADIEHVNIDILELTLVADHAPKCSHRCAGQACALTV